MLGQIDFSGDSIYPELNDRERDGDRVLACRVGNLNGK